MLAIVKYREYAAMRPFSKLLWTLVDIFNENLALERIVFTKSTSHISGLPE